MDSNSTAKDQRLQDSFINMCSINICGMSQRSQLMLNKYVYDKKIDILAVQETGKNGCFKKLLNTRMYEDTNGQDNKGCAIYISDRVQFTPLTDLAKMSKKIDTVWGLALHQGRRTVVGNVYLKLDYEVGIEVLVNMIEQAILAAKKHHAQGLIVMGDFNARNTLWNDSCHNKYGKLLQDRIDWTKLCIVAPNVNTFLTKDGGSIIDFFITSCGIDDRLS